MVMNWLKLNDEKTFSLLLRTLTVGPYANISDIIIGDNNITSSTSARNLCAIFDEHLTMEVHVNMFAALLSSTCTTSANYETDA